MAIGESSYFSNNSGSDTNATRKSNNEYSYYSRYSFLNEEKNLSLRFEFRSGLLQFKIVTRTADGSGWNQDASEIIYLSPAKAAMLDHQIEKFKDYLHNSKSIDENVAFGVTGGMNEFVSFVAFHTNKDKNIMISIGKFDGNGVITQKHTYKNSLNFNYALDWKDLDNMKVDKAYYNELELDLIHQMVKDFARGMSGAIGYGVHDIGRYDLSRVLNKLDPIYDKLGIERLQSSQRNRGTNNFLSSMDSGSGASNFSSGSNSVSSIDDLIG